MHKLTRGTKELDVISIFGNPRLGKTTLVMKVYNNSSIVNHFDVKVWCSVSQAYNRQKLLAEILKQARSDKSELNEVREFCLRKLTEEKFMQLIVPYSPYQHLYSKEPRLSIYIHSDLVKQLDHGYQLDKIPMLESKETQCFGECPMSSLEFIAHPRLNTWNRSNPLPLLVKLRLVRVLHFPEVLGLIQYNH
ncbi:hypothetical protein RDI58_015825 [Solanum bulbocastanum]|uniref:NB-ARC domain-containing protein n=1 Tax=Solanum bulbocastanum TaxID=147425 RepID=A0AAN8YBU1_SOLBU